MATTPGITVPVTVDYRGPLNDEQQRRAEALRIAGNVLAGRNIMAPQAAVPERRSTDDVTALAQWLLDGSTALNSTLEFGEATTDALNTPAMGLAAVRVLLPVPAPYLPAAGADVDTDDLVAVSRHDLRYVVQANQHPADGCSLDQARVRLVKAARA